MLAAGCTTPAGPTHADLCGPRPAGQSQCLPASRPAPVAIAANGSTTAWVDARCMWNRTGVLLVREGTYSLAVSRTTEPWKDAWLRSDLRTGWPWYARWIDVLARPRARDPHSPMYSLLTAQGERPETFRVLGDSGTMQASFADELLLFANDWPGHYDNNFGCLEITVRRLS